MYLDQFLSLFSFSFFCFFFLTFVLSTTFLCWDLWVSSLIIKGEKTAVFLSITLIISHSFGFLCSYIYSIDIIYNLFWFLSIHGLSSSWFSSVITFLVTFIFISDLLDCDKRTLPVIFWIILWLFMDKYLFYDVENSHCLFGEESVYIFLKLFAYFCIFLFLEYLGYLMLQKVY